MSTDIAAVARFYPGLQCTTVYRNPHHWSGHESIWIAVHGSKANLLRYGLITAAVIEALPTPSYLIFRRDDGRSLVVTRRRVKRAEFEVEITGYGESAETLRAVVGCVPSARLRLASEISRHTCASAIATARREAEYYQRLCADDTPELAASAPAKPRPSYLRLVVDNSRGMEVSHGR
jgi:hypothetical protein